MAICSTWPHPTRRSLPDCYVFPPDKLPPATSAVVSLPIINLSRSRDEVCRAILDAGKELSFFQVINHGVPEQTVWDMEEFFRLLAADKPDFYSEDTQKANRLFTGSAFDTDGEKYWRDYLRLTCTFPAGDSTKDWPDKPQRLRGKWNLDINHYPPCPIPGMTLRLLPHYDPFLITILHPGPVPGLEVAYKGEWIKVEPVANAFVVNFGHPRRL
ncbi:hypothetical protein ACP70R_018749 [Stipagrostis hirtigluma subsp. patula]